MDPFYIFKFMNVMEELKKNVDFTTPRRLTLPTGVGTPEKYSGYMFTTPNVFPQVSTPQAPNRV